jgi:gluconokinase
MTRFVVMGVSGCGKSLIGQAFATAIGAAFIDGDSLHPPANIAKMRRGEPLNDTDRAPWLHKVGDTLAMDGTVVACSALKRAYRDQIRAVAGAPVIFLFLRGTRDTLLQRMSSRPGHFMPPALLDSQLATLEPPEGDETYLAADIDQTPDQIVTTFLAALKEPLT